MAVTVHFVWFRTVGLQTVGKHVYAALAIHVHEGWNGGSESMPMIALPDYGESATAAIAASYICMSPDSCLHRIAKSTGP